MIRFSDVSFTYDGADRPTLDRVDLTIGEGELCVVVGPTGLGQDHTAPGASTGWSPTSPGDG